MGRNCNRYFLHERGKFRREKRTFLRQSKTGINPIDRSCRRLIFAFGMTWLIGKFVDKVVGLRVSAAEESVGLDISQHGERAYGGNLR